jgi:uncharacterized membrane protein YfcA
MIAGLIILGLAFVQNVSFSIVSRSRNRDNIAYHIIAATASNTIWFLTFKQLIVQDMPYWLIPFYVLGTVLGSVFGVKVSMWIENLIGAKADKSHIQKLEERLEKLEKRG